MKPRRAVAGLSREDRKWLQDEIEFALPNATATARADFTSEVECAVKNYRRRCIEEIPVTTAEFRRTVRKMRNAVATLDSNIPGERTEVFAALWGAYQGESAADNPLAFTRALKKIDAALAAVEAGLNGRQPRRSGHLDGLVFELVRPFAKAFNVAPTSTALGPFARVASVVLTIATGNDDREVGHRQLLRVLKHHGEMMTAMGDALDPPSSAQWEVAGRD